VKVLYRFGLGLIKGLVEHAMLVFLYVCMYVCVAARCAGTSR
jgi:hypothetical protein